MWMDSVMNRFNRVQFQFLLNLPSFVLLIQTDFLTKINIVLTASIGVFYKTLDIVGQCFIHHVSTHGLDSWRLLIP